MNRFTDLEQQESIDPRQWANLPRDFFWGVSTSAYQIEGATQEDGRGRSIWDDFSATPGKTYLGETGEIAVDHYHRAQEDVGLLGTLGVNAYCFSISWSRVFPTGSGTVNAVGLDFYDRLVDTLLAKGITPVAKLYHWDLPSGLQERGGWVNRDTTLAFADYADYVAQRLGDRVDWWLTHNEPWCVSYLGHGIGVHAPGIRDMQQAVDAAHHVLLSHGLAIPRIRAHTSPQSHVGITVDYYPIHSADDTPETALAVVQADAFRNRWFLDPLFKKQYPEHLFESMGVTPPPIHEGDFETIATPIDFLGLNYYSRWIIRGLPENGTTPLAQYEQVTTIPNASFTQMGWEIYPEGLQEMLERINRDYAPPAIIITESGAAFPDQWDGGTSVRDAQRASYLNTHIQSIGKAAANGVPLQGYFAWSLLDNYEWSEGYSKRFGIIYVDFPTQKRIIKSSGLWYANFIATLQEPHKLGVNGVESQEAEEVL